MKILLVVNPQARSGRMMRLLTPISQAFSSHGVEFEILKTRHCGSAKSQLATHDLEAYDGVVAVGGDGTVFDVLNGLYQHVPICRPPMGVIPVGTGNAFSRDLGLEPGDWREAVSIIAAGNIRRIDTGRVKTKEETFYFLNILAQGFAINAGQTAQKFKKLGNASYTLGTLWQTLWLHTQNLTLEIDGETLEQENLFVEVANTRYTGTRFLIAPQAKFDDGFLDVIVVRKLSRIRLLSLFPTIYTGRHVEYPEVSVIKARTVRFISPQNSLLGPDGEFHGQTPAQVDCLHQDLELFAPA